jgi:hypothetical protein
MRKTIAPFSIVSATLVALLTVHSAAADDDPESPDAADLEEEPENDQELAGAPCGSARPGDHDDDDSMRVVWTAAMRSGSGPSCDNRAWMQAGYRVNPYCYVYAPSNGYTWTYAWWAGFPAQHSGWIRDDHLENNGSPVPCPEFIVPPDFLKEPAD